MTYDFWSPLTFLLQTTSGGNSASKTGVCGGGREGWGCRRKKRRTEEGERGMEVVGGPAMV